MIAKVCDRESRRDTWFENRLVKYTRGKTVVAFFFSVSKLLSQVLNFLLIDKNSV